MSPASDLLLDPSALMARVREGMIILNQIADEHPQAISLAAGRPDDAHARLGAVDDAIDRFARTLRERGERDAPIWQYGPTAGLMQGTIAEALAIDEGVRVDPRSILVTVGAQEGMFLALTLLDRARDVLLVPDPTYVGILGAAAVAGVSVSPIPADQLDPASIRGRIRALAAVGCRARALYLVPDFANPLGDTIPAARRAELLALARELDLWLLEDSPYRAFAFDEAPPPSLLAGAAGEVIHLGSLAKVLSPGLRLGYVAWPGAPEERWRALIAAKSFVSVNTSPLAQAIAAGTLALRGSASLLQAAAEARATYRRRRDVLLAAMAEELEGIPGLRWQIPGGGFFVVLHLPFEFDADDMRRCAGEARVLVCPLSLFSPTGGGRRAIRLSYSYAPLDALAEGVRRLGAHLRRRLEARCR